MRSPVEGGEEFTRRRAESVQRSMEAFDLQKGKNAGSLRFFDYFLTFLPQSCGKIKMKVRLSVAVLKVLEL